MDSSFNYKRELNQVLFKTDSFYREVILNNPSKLNCLSYDMVSQMLKKFRDFETDSTVKFVILKGNGKAFCAGGDVVSSVRVVMAEGHWSFIAGFYKKILILDYLLATYQKHLIAMINGLVMGGGAGLSMHATFKIVTEKAVFSMPEVHIGNFPDVGASHFLSRLPGYFGEYLGLTGARLNGAEMFACGLATHFVLSKDLPLLENAFKELRSFEITSIYQVINRFAQNPILKEDSIYQTQRLETVNKCFSKNSVEEILLALEKEEKNKGEIWMTKAINSMNAASPLSLKIALRSIREGRHQNLKQCLVREYTICCNIIRATVSYDFFEGIRAMLLKKGKKPKWEPSKLELVNNDMVDRCFTDIDEDDWKRLQLPDRSSNACHVFNPKL